MTSMTLLPIKVDGWTVGDLDELPEGYRYEIVDGSLLVTPPPVLGHDIGAAELAFRLRRALSDEYRLALAPGLHFDQRNYRQPDVVVFRREALVRDRLTPEHAALVVEVMSPSSVSNDRVSKPAQYAHAGIPHYWRLEREPELVLVTHELDGDVYRETARFTDEVALERPVALRFRLGELFE